MSNHLKISCPDVATSVGEISLNGKRLDDVVAFKVEASASEPYVRVTVEFLSAFEFDGFGEAKTQGRTLDFTSR